MLMRKWIISHKQIGVSDNKLQLFYHLFCAYSGDMM